MCVRPRTHPQVHLGSRNLQTIKKYAGHEVVIMLPRMQKDFFVPLSELAADCRSLHELRPRPYHRYELHLYGRSLSRSLKAGVFTVLRRKPIYAGPVFSLTLIFRSTLPTRLCCFSVVSVC